MSFLTISNTSICLNDSLTGELLDEINQNCSPIQKNKISPIINNKFISIHHTKDCKNVDIQELSIINVSNSKLFIENSIHIINDLKLGNSSSSISIRNAWFSPTGEYIVILVRRFGGSFDKESNVYILSYQRLEIVLNFYVPNLSSEQYDVCLFINNVIIRSFSSNIVYYMNNEKINLFEIPEKSKLLNIDTFENYLIFVIKSNQTSILYTYIFENGEFRKLGQKTLLRTDQATFNWKKDNENNYHVLITCSEDIDKTGSSYFGTSSLLLVTIKNINTLKYHQVINCETGPVHSIDWCPMNTDFIVCYGQLPRANLSIIDAIEPSLEKCILYGPPTGILSSMGTSRNYVRYSGNGRCVIAAGIGSLAGDVDVIDVKLKKKINTVNLNSAVSIEYDPISAKGILVASTFPRMKVDNGWKLYSYDLSEIIAENIASREAVRTIGGSGDVVSTIQVFSSQYIPAPEGHIVDDFPVKAISSTKTESNTAKPKAYRPPGQSSSFSDAFAAARVSSSYSGMSASITNNIKSGGIPGLSQTNNAPKKPKKTKKKQNQPVTAAPVIELGEFKLPGQ